jgi:ankyrin repeat protein
MNKYALIFCLLLTITAALATPPNKELFTAVMKNNVAQVESLLIAGADPNTAIEVVPGFPTTYLITAANNGSLEVVKALVKHKAQVNQPGAFRATALMAAAGKGHKTVVEFLLASGADAKAKDDDGKDALALAQEGGHAEVVKLLAARLK